EANAYAARLWLPPYDDDWHRAAHAELDLELTRLVLETRRRLAEGTPAAELAGERPSVVAGVDWRFEVGPEAVTIRAVGDLPDAAGTGDLVHRMSLRGARGEGDDAPATG
ncbi:MAG TPA: hypothetical protein VKU40_01270, partial [Thermoanaerobaculia bacterium]|nr:hypothetical protein [Thermoanaerobaculia bacterium]